MENETTILSFGEINYFEGVGIYTATSNWEQLSKFWEIKMYQNRPDSEESVELPSMTLLAEDLWSPSKEIYDELEEWDFLSDEALLDFEKNLD